MQFLLKRQRKKEHMEKLLYNLFSRKMVKGKKKYGRNFYRNLLADGKESKQNKIEREKFCLKVHISWQKRTY